MENGVLSIKITRDCEGRFEPQLIPIYQTRQAGFDEKIISLYSRAMTAREIQTHLTKMYGIDVSPILISSVADTVVEDLK